MITGHRHHRAIHQGRQRRNLGGVIQQGLPAFPAASWEQAQGASMVHGAIEIVGLIPGGQTLIPAQPKAVPEGAQPPKQRQEKPEHARSHHPPSC